jgi:hypothetical protein
LSQHVKTGVRPTYQEILRSVGAWLDMRGYQEIRIIEGPEGLAVEGFPAVEGNAPERLLIANDQIGRFCDASRLNRDAPPPLSPEPSGPHLTLVLGGLAGVE